MRMTPLATVCARGGWIACATLLASSLAPLPARAVTRADLARCAAIAEDAARLACYDALSARAPQEPEPLQQPAPRAETTEPRPEEIGRRAEPPPPSAEEQFGLEPRRPPEVPTKITAGLIRAQEDAYGKLLFTLDNGQVWKQTDWARLVIRGEQPRRVEISKKLFGSYWLKLEGRSKSIRVERVR